MKTIRIHLDAHAHIYPCHDITAWLVSALDHMPRTAPGDLRAICLAERDGESFFQGLAQDEIRLPAERWKITAWDPDGAIQVCHLPDRRQLWILAGRQSVAAERIEIACLFRDLPLEDGAPARDLIHTILAGGGLPALPWSPGKWMFQRGKIIRRLLEEFPPAQLAIVDTSLRWMGWPAPRVYSRARTAGRLILAGSDPLPFPGEEYLAGSYHTCLQIPAPAKESRLLAPLQSALASGAPVSFGGRRGSPWSVLRRLRQHARRQKTKNQP